MYEIFKRYLTDDGMFYGLLFVCVAVGSFGLGRWSAGEGGRPPATPAAVTITPAAALPPTSAGAPVAAPAAATQAATVANTLQAAVLPAATVVGSKNGTKYHLPTCPGAKQIRPENLVTFPSTQAAEAAGYSPAANCPGL